MARKKTEDKEPQTAAEQASEEPQAAKLSPEQKQLERIERERQIRKYVRRDGGFRKGISNADKMTANALLHAAGRKKAVWDHSIDLNMINYKSKVRPKISPNSID